MDAKAIEGTLSNTSFWLFEIFYINLIEEIAIWEVWIFHWSDGWSLDCFTYVLSSRSRRNLWLKALMRSEVRWKCLPVWNNNTSTLQQSHFQIESKALGIFTNQLESVLALSLFPLMSLYVYLMANADNFQDNTHLHIYGRNKQRQRNEE